MQIQDFGPNDVIQCKTLEEAEQLLKMFDSLGLKWITGKSYSDLKWGLHKEKTCYYPKAGTYASLGFYQENGFTIYQASDFLYPITQKTVYKIFGREFEERMDAEEFREKVMKFYVAESPEEIAEML